MSLERSNFVLGQGHRANDSEANEGDATDCAESQATRHECLGRAWRAHPPGREITAHEATQMRSAREGRREDLIDHEELCG